MIHLDLDEQERQILDETLQSYLSDLSYEIADTDQQDYRDQLKAKRAVLTKIKEALDQTWRPDVTAVLAVTTVSPVINSLRPGLADPLASIRCIYSSGSTTFR